jgi:acetyl-CoA carboxylase biotin carboxylase subunit
MAKRTAGALGLPLVPGSDGADQEIGEAKKIAEAAGYPVIIKAASGGGGRGMKVCNSPDELETLMQQAGSEAKAAFGDATVYIEKYLGNPRHIEFQVFGDGEGNAIHLGERDCSLQRRHQKVLEEAPSPVISCRRARPHGRHRRQGDGRHGLSRRRHDRVPVGKWRVLFHRDEHPLQVEHPVTEMITGFDLVREQIRVAEGAAVGHAGDARIRGHAIECRINAEDPRTFAPSPGR